jgi:hypothetical protein
MFASSLAAPAPLPIVAPPEAGVQGHRKSLALGSRFRGNDGWELRRQFLSALLEDHRGAIMIVGALVLVDVTVGITEASITRSP